MNKKEKESCKKSHSDFTEKPRINTDPLGSWTGTPDDPTDLPVQDVDEV